MASSSNKMLAGTPLVAVGTAAAATQVAVTVTAPTNPTQRLMLYGVIFSTTGTAPTAAVAATIGGLAGSTPTITIGIPGAAFAPIGVMFGTHPLPCAVSTNLVVTLPAMSAGAVGYVTVIYEVDTAP